MIHEWILEVYTIVGQAVPNCMAYSQPIRSNDGFKTVQLHQGGKATLNSLPVGSQSQFLQLRPSQSANLSADCESELKHAEFPPVLH